MDRVFAVVVGCDVRTSALAGRTSLAHDFGGLGIGARMYVGGLAELSGIGGNVERPIFRIAAFDLSLINTGGVSVPSDWGGDWSKVQTFECGATIKKDERTKSAETDRLIGISDKIRAFCCQEAPSIVAIAKSGWGSQPMSGIHTVVTVDLWRYCKIAVEELPENTSRAFLCGRVPRKPENAAKNWTKNWVRAELSAVGAPREWSSDVADAMVLCNLMLHRCDCFSYSKPAPPRPKRARQVRGS